MNLDISPGRIYASSRICTVDISGNLQAGLTESAFAGVFRFVPVFPVAKQVAKTVGSLSREAMSVLNCAFFQFSFFIAGMRRIPPRRRPLPPAIIFGAPRMQGCWGA